MSNLLNNQIESVHGDGLDLPKVKTPFNDYETVTIKHISYVGLAPVNSIFLVWSTYTNSYVASFTIDSNEFKANQQLDMVIQLNKSSYEMGFKLFYYNPVSTILMPSTFASFCCIILEFNKYK
jgi:hypothetical protein